MSADPGVDYVPLARLVMAFGLVAPVLFRVGVCAPAPPGAGWMRNSSYPCRHLILTILPLFSQYGVLFLKSLTLDRP